MSSFLTQHLFDNEEINLFELCEKDPKLANDIIKNTSEYPSLYKKTLTNIPYVLFSNKGFRTSNVNKIVCVKGVVIRAHQVFLKNSKIEYSCLKCNFKGVADDLGVGKKNIVVCEACGSTATIKKECLGNAIKTQVIRIQDIGNISNFSEIFEILLEGDSAGKYSPGEEIIVAGVLKLKYKTLKQNEPIMMTTYLHALYVNKAWDDGVGNADSFVEFDEISRLETFKKRLFLINSLTDDIHGFSNVKLGILLVLSNGHIENTNSNRQMSHILLIGDSGTGKSTFLNICTKLISPAILTNGVSTSNAGLTSCAVKQGKEWSLEAGALVLADTGICCIDEFNKLKVNEKGGLLESMEQQTLSVAKAGIVSSLNTRCSIIAACNMRNYYNKNKTVSENTMISTPLVSRFDLIFGLFDSRNNKLDDCIAEKILNRSTVQIDDSKTRYNDKWTAPTLKRYLSKIRKLDIKIDVELSKILSMYYNARRKKEDSNEFNTIRMLESLIRLSEGHAKLLNKKRVEKEDVYTAILLMESCINSTSLVSLKYHEMFTDENVYNECLKIVKEKYKLDLIC
ncbi:putative DNA helicase MCM9 [Nosema granulosis]|uniref:DNA helicase n=1 Tax=Nosema granulosis TaxID=83296 RepID=A0A9P6H032_9MICR|nr:putative DNA helicase MCM9 [Nosema granulosis]